jgi:2-C-methyl-D-erythritol 4-phosphate cytidylyltransferase
LPRDVGVVIVAAGEGRRLGGSEPKQFQPIRGVPMLLWALRPFSSHPDVFDIVVVLPAGIAARMPEWLQNLVEAGLRVVPGGMERMDSVEQGLRALGPQCTIALVHDAARPFVGRDVIDAVIGRARSGAGAIAALPVSDTLKQSSGEGDAVLVDRTLSRDGVWRAQTPQGFPRAMLDRAYAKARSEGLQGTDEASLVEQLGEKVYLVPDSGTNIKVTTPSDLALAELIAGFVQ